VTRSQTAVRIPFPKKMAWNKRIQSIPNSKMMKQKVEKKLENFQTDHRRD